MREAAAWADESPRGNRFQRNITETLRYADIESRFDRQARDLVGRFAAGSISRDELIGRFRSGLRQAETDAFAAGRRARGIASSSITDAEASMLAGRHSRNMRYFHNFVSDIDSGRGRMPYGQRAGMYAKSLWSIYTRGESHDWGNDDPNARYYWILDPDAEHCPDCLKRAGDSMRSDGFTWEEMTERGWPGESTLCFTDCRCHIRTINRRTVLPERAEQAEPAATAQSGIDAFEQLLGGPNLPLRLPVAGLPGAKISPEIVAESLAADPLSDELAKVLPMVPIALLKPDKMLEFDTTRWYSKGPLRVGIERGSNGIWRVISLIFAKGGPK